MSEVKNIARGNSEMAPIWNRLCLGVTPPLLPPPQPFPQSVLSRLRYKSRTITFPAGSRIFGPGQASTHLLLLLDGVVRVQQVSDRGREIVLYRVLAADAGGSLTTEFLMDYDGNHTEGIAETRICAFLISHSLFDELIATSREFRDFAFSTFSHRCFSLIRLIEELAFSRIDERLAQKLIELAMDNGRVAVTHQRLANELGSAREVISRQINEFQRRGWVKASRGNVDIEDRAALFRLAQQS
ncbi:Crp/Fnr family transcriptional regulator [Bradyrhizobium ottawaense]|uniref:Crp/Fnr family transcriptional regulator n=1 Tax=Bradyrhizobium ottawaense TaxID=931866 RepID=UPI001FD937EC|nr:Crp/Fnr family transcriptional regulator [Bradyrhizobium ottawaense]